MRWNVCEGETAQGVILRGRVWARGEMEAQSGKERRGRERERETEREKAMEMGGGVKRGERETESESERGKSEGKSARARSRVSCISQLHGGCCSRYAAPEIWNS